MEIFLEINYGLYEVSMRNQISKLFYCRYFIVEGQRSPGLVCSFTTRKLERKYVYTVASQKVSQRCTVCVECLIALSVFVCRPSIDIPLRSALERLRVRATVYQVTQLRARTLPNQRVAANCTCQPDIIDPMQRGDDEGVEGTE